MGKYTVSLLLLALLTTTGLIQANQEQAIELFEAGNLEQAKQQFEELATNKEEKPIALMYLAKIAMKEDDLDEAEDLMEEAVELSPKNAEIHFFNGLVNGEIAQEASIFTALGYAKTTRKSFAKAVTLEPDNINYRQALLGYHVAAPSIAGGDKDIALEQAKAIKALDLKKGLMALASVYNATENEDAINNLYANIPEKLKLDPEILIQKAFFHQSRENFPEAIKAFKLTIKHAADIEEFQEPKFGAIYQIGRSSVLSESNVDEGIENLKLFIDTAPTEGNLPSKDWAKFRLANLIEIKGEKKQARSLYKQLKKTTKDKRLIKAIKKAL